MRGVRGIKLGTLAVSAALVLAACGSSGGGSGNSSSAAAGGGGSSTPPAGGASSSTASQITKVGMAYDVGGRGDKSFNDLAAAGLDKAKSQLNVQTKELAATNGESEQSKESRLTLLAQQGYNPVVAVGFGWRSTTAHSSRSDAFDRTPHVRHSRWTRSRLRCVPTPRGSTVAVLPSVWSWTRTSTPRARNRSGAAR